MIEIINRKEKFTDVAYNWKIKRENSRNIVCKNLGARIVWRTNYLAILKFVLCKCPIACFGASLGSIEYFFSCQLMLIISMILFCIQILQNSAFNRPMHKTRHMTIELLLLYTKHLGESEIRCTTCLSLNFFENRCWLCLSIHFVSSCNTRSR